MKTKPFLSFWQIWNLTFGFLGIQFGFALQNANSSRILQTYGADVEQLSLFWLAAPLTGMIIQPIIGHYSDQTWCRLGRRRPFFLVGAIFTTIALILMPNAGLFLSPGTETAILSPVLIGAGMLMIMDASINVTMEPFRALVGDMLPDEQHTTGFSIQTFLIDNFMPVFDWTRTQLDKEAEDGSTSLVMYWEQMKGLDPLKDDIHLPGWDSSYTQDEVRELIRAYGEIGEKGLWENIEYFLKRVIPVAEECGVVMALHPDDPPYPIFGLPRVITCEENLDRYLSIVDSPANSLCLCTGSLGSSPKNDIPAMVRKYSSMNRIGFMHIRNVKILPDTSFEESGHLTQNGSLDMNAIVKALVETGFDGYFRPDHGRMIWDEVAMPGYGLYDRALGATYLNGLWEAIEKSHKQK